MSTNNKYTPKLVGETKIKFSIPIYQRLFAWSKTEVIQLLNDLSIHFNNHGDTPYYIGMLTVLSEDNSISLIDGQQRFTVMTLLGICFKKYYTKWEDFISLDRLEFVARSDDKDYLNAKIAGVKSTYNNEQMESAISAISTYIESLDDKEGFAQRVYENLTFFLSELPSHYSKTPALLNRYFEIMNSGGRSLEQHEVLKVDMLKLVGDVSCANELDLMAIWNKVSQMDVPLIKACDEVQEQIQKYNSAISACRDKRYNVAMEILGGKIENDDSTTILDIGAQKQDFNKKDTEVKYGSILDFPEFLLFVLYMIKGESTSLKKYELGTIFRDHKFTADGALDFILLMLKFRLIFDLYVIRRDFTTPANGYTLLLKDEERKLMQFQSMLYVVSYNSSLSSKFKWLKCLFNYIEKNENIESESILNTLKAYDNSVHTKENFSKVNLSYYNDDNNKIDRYWFWRLDYYLWENRGLELFRDKDDRKCVDGYIFRPFRSIEHLYPQHSDDQNVIWEGKALHSFGNLAMISVEFNSTQSDDPVDVKFARIKSQAERNALQSIKLYLMYKAAEGNALNWTMQKASDHEQRMKTIIEDSYNNS